MNISAFAGGVQAARFLESTHGHLIENRWCPSLSGKTFDVFNPGDGRVIARVADGGSEDVDLAVAAARRAFESGPWKKMPPNDRAKLLWRLADLLEIARDEIGLIETLDNGKPLRVSTNFDVNGAADRLRYYAGFATKLTGETMSVSLRGDHHAFTLREPVGVCGLIVPWNFPLMMAVAKLAPALAAGCTTILKPAEQTPLSALRLGELILEAGFPPGVVNIVTGFGETGAAITAHPGVDKVSFTGSTDVGRLIVRAAAGNFKRVTLELGGKSPVIVLPDADVGRAIPGVSEGIFRNSGQVCAAGSRVYAHEKVFDQLVQGIAEYAKNLKVGPGIEAGTDLGPLVSLEQQDRVTGFIAAGLRDGASILSGGGTVGDAGYFLQPTVLIHTRPEMSVVREEIFGPVLCAMSFNDDDLDKITAEANDTPYGLSAYIWTQNLSAAHRLVSQLKAGFVRVNGGGLDSALPFGGVKHSGWGRENGREGIEAYTELKSVIMSV